MILNKQVGVFLNLVHCQFKQFLNSVFQKHGFNLTPEQYLVMDTLWDEGVLSQQQIADILLKDKNSVTKLIDALENKGLVKRIADLKDRRQNKIHLTDKAVSLKDDITVIAIETTNAIIKDIPKEDLIRFVKVLNKMSENMDAYNKD
ncbi:MAG: MarR family transcriptional regulator [Bacteroidia bacterium]|jgi:DNA-binding MarR family transcriptional regulator|nr:MarR family transcriptional regulator [Bacteroidales bacterium]MDD3299385.1 MarR family transcriptional regulator [Bacteroidales bacterium]MDD3843837.1 MarR family transcriptional regulator [Bacteroidales bacterium]MDD4618278.1 MarR family transcriptional regulator [Bacteroidales bacterium]NCC46421.1 MarR family transcriptional regulator [Bacteroidia bacterium]